MVLDCCVNFCAVGIPLMVSSFVMVASLILQIVGCVTPLWFNFTYKSSAAVSPSADGYQGFFGHCYRDTEYMCCGTIDDYYDKIGGKPDWMEACQVLAIISVCTAVIAIALVYVASCCVSRTIAIPAVIVTCVTVVTLGALLVTFASNVGGESWTETTDYGFSFFMVLFAMIGHLACAILILLGICTAAALT